jgi:hypothetical protein
MPTNIDELIPNASTILKEATLRDAEKANEYASRIATAESEKKSLIDLLSQTSSKSEEEKIRLVSNVIHRAVRNGFTEVLLYRFSNSLCTDRGRAINCQEPGWEKTLTGIPKEIYQLWSEHLKPRGYRISYETMALRGGMPSDVGVTIAWGD